MYITERTSVLLIRTIHLWLVFTITHSQKPGYTLRLREAWWNQMLKGNMSASAAPGRVKQKIRNFASSPNKWCTGSVNTSIEFNETPLHSSRGKREGITWQWQEKTAVFAWLEHAPIALCSKIFFGKFKKIICHQFHCMNFYCNILFDARNCGSKNVLCFLNFIIQVLLALKLVQETLKVFAI